MTVQFCRSVSPGWPLPYWGSWAGRQSLVHHCLQPEHSLSVMQTARTSSSHQGQQAAQWLDPSWRTEDYMVDTQVSHYIDPQTCPPLSLTHMLEFRSQISSCPSLTTPNTVAHLGDHLMSHTALWLEVKTNTGQWLSCVHSWMVQSEEQLRNAAGLSGDHVTQFTGHWGGESHSHMYISV